MVGETVRDKAEARKVEAEERPIHSRAKTPDQEKVKVAAKAREGIVAGTDNIQPVELFAHYPASRRRREHDEARAQRRYERYVIRLRIWRAMPWLLAAAIAGVVVAWIVMAAR